MSYQRAPMRGPSKASATTQCQKCLQRGHYSYECSAKPQERPYISRPSRTAQLRDPRLKQRLTEALPPAPDPPATTASDTRASGASSGRGRKRSRSRGRESSVDSVSTVSTNASPKRDASRGSRERKIRRRSSSPGPRGRRGSSQDRKPGRGREDTAEYERRDGDHAARRAEGHLRRRSGDEHEQQRGSDAHMRDDARGGAPGYDADDRRQRYERSVSPYSRRVGLTEAMG